MKRVSFAVVALGLMIAPLTAFAQQDGEANEPIQEKTIYDFPEDIITSCPSGPNDGIIWSSLPERPRNLLNTRQDFVPELLESVEEL